ncbi:hypothetical protein CDIK_0211 [Cucumispora dikerogammari]|nr:hypothetical protein CDIK_0211 [Cucumispora dikerogammari]
MNDDILDENMSFDFSTTPASNNSLNLSISSQDSMESLGDLNEGKDSQDSMESLSNLNEEKPAQDSINSFSDFNDETDLHDMISSICNTEKESKPQDDMSSLSDFSVEIDSQDMRSSLSVFKKEVKSIDTKTNQSDSTKEISAQETISKLREHNREITSPKTIAKLQDLEKESETQGDMTNVSSFSTEIDSQDMVSTISDSKKEIKSKGTIFTLSNSKKSIKSQHSISSLSDFSDSQDMRSSQCRFSNGIDSAGITSSLKHLNKTVEVENMTQEQTILNKAIDLTVTKINDSNLKTSAVPEHMIHNSVDLNKPIDLQDTISTESDFDTSIDLSVSQTPLSYTLTSGSNFSSYSEASEEKLSKKKIKSSKLNGNSNYKTDILPSIEIKSDIEEFNISSLDNEGSYGFDSNTTETTNNQGELLKNAGENINRSVYSSVYGDFIKDNSILDFDEKSLAAKNQETCLNSPLGFVTGNNKAIVISETELKKGKKFLNMDISQEASKPKTYIEPQEKESLDVSPSDESLLSISSPDQDLQNIDNKKKIKSKGLEIHRASNFLNKTCSTKEIQFNIPQIHYTTKSLNKTCSTKGIEFKVSGHKPFEYTVGHPSTLLILKSRLQQFKFSNVFDFQLFKYSCLHLQHTKNNISVLDITAEISRRKNNEFSVLRRIFEKDEIPSVLCVLTVLERCKTDNPEIFEYIVFDGFYEAKLIVSSEIEQEFKDNKLKGCFNIQVSGMRIISELKDFEKFCLKVDYNCLSLTSRSVGFQREKAVIKAFSSIKYSGLISALEFKIVKIINRKVTLKCGDFKETFVDGVETPENVRLKEKFLKTIKKYQKIDEVEPIRFSNFLIRDFHNQTAILTWFNCPEVVDNQLVRLSNVKVGKLIGLSFVTCFITEVDMQ